MTYFTCALCGMWEDTYMIRRIKIGSKGFCERCYDKVIEKYPHLEEYTEFDPSESTWQMDEPKKKLPNISWKTIMPTLTTKDRNCLT